MPLPPICSSRSWAFVAPASALSASSLVAAKYLGFMYESLPKSSTVNQSLTTQLVSFGSAAAGAGTAMTGGVFPDDDPHRLRRANITVNFGTQSGLYTAATVTIPDTSTVAGTCAKNGGTPGTAPSGSLTCGFAAVAIAGNPNSKFAVFLIGQDPTQSNAPSAFTSTNNDNGEARATHEEQQDNKTASGHAYVARGYRRRDCTLVGWL